MSSARWRKAVRPAPRGTLIPFPALPGHGAAIPQLQPRARLVTALCFWAGADAAAGARRWMWPAGNGSFRLIESICHRDRDARGLSALKITGS